MLVIHGDRVVRYRRAAGVVLGARRVRERAGHNVRVVCRWGWADLLFKQTGVHYFKHLRKINGVFKEDDCRLQQRRRCRLAVYTESIAAFLQMNSADEGGGVFEELFAPSRSGGTQPPTCLTCLVDYFLSKATESSDSCYA